LGVPAEKPSRVWTESKTDRGRHLSLITLVTKQTKEGAKLDLAQLN
jgi:hypothetical protein